ncbi:hypothetical protein Gpo141_00009584 [Globisporangium polare]
MAGGSLFRVGDNVELWRVLAYLSLLVACIILLEQALHLLKHKLAKYPKYHDMMSKVFGELMVLGFVGLVLKLFKEFSHANAYSRSMIAFQAADLTVFILAMALILQAICVFFLLRSKNVQVDKAELVSSEHLLDVINKHAVDKVAGGQSLFSRVSSSLAQAKENATAATTSTIGGSNRIGTTPGTKIRESDFPELIQMRILRHFFLRTHKLPELFPFSKYLRQAQDNQITHMIEVEMSTWIMLIAVAWGLESVSTLVQRHYDLEERRSIVYVFLVFSWLSVLLHLAVLMYMRWATEQILSAAGEHFGRTTKLKCLKAVADSEVQAEGKESVADAIGTMEIVRDTEREKKIQRRRFHITEHDTGFQLVATICRNLARICRHKRSSSAQEAASALAAANTGDAEAGTGAPQQQPPHSLQKDALYLRWFSRKAWHFVVMWLLMLNGLYVALFFQCVLYELVDDFRALDTLVIICAPVSLVVNMIFFQSRIMRSFVLVSCIVRVDDAALGDVIDHFTETVELRAEFVATVTSFMEKRQLTIADMEAEFEAKDTEKTGLLEVEDVRLVLRHFGFTLSYFRFNSVVKLLFTLQGTQVEYAQVGKLLTFAKQHDSVRRLYDETSRMRSLEDTDALGELEEFHDNRVAPLVRRASSKAARSLYQLDYAEKEVEI